MFSVNRRTVSASSAHSRRSRLADRCSRRSRSHRTFASRWFMALALTHRPVVLVVGAIARAVPGPGPPGCSCHKSQDDRELRGGKKTAAGAWGGAGLENVTTRAGGFVKV